MKRPQKALIKRDLNQKIVILTGPRQVGKTTLAKSFSDPWRDLYYLNYDASEDRKIFIKKEWDRNTDLVVFDEIHKYRKWKTHLKGVYDKEGIPPRLLVTGSARLDFYRKGGDSLAGRYFLHRLYPLSVAELKKQGDPQEILEQLTALGGFPEPYLKGSETAGRRWRRTHLDRIIREDIQDLEPVKDVGTLILLVDLLKDRVKNTISYSNLARDLEVSPHTVKKWLATLENLYVIFMVRPYHKNIARAILKEPKVYFYDSGAVVGDLGAKFENTVAVCLRKWLHYLEDSQGRKTALHYIRDKEKREVDFAVFIDGKLEYLIEVKASEKELDRSIYYYSKKIRPTKSLQMTYQPIRSRTVEGIQIQSAAPWLAKLDI